MQEENKDHKNLKKKIKLFLKKIENYEENEQFILSMKPTSFCEKASKKLTKILRNLQSKIDFFTNSLNNFFDEVSKKCKVNMIVKFSKFKVPKFKFKGSEKIEEDDKEEKQSNFYEYEQEVDLLNIQVPNLEDQIDYLDNIQKNYPEEIPKSPNIRNRNTSLTPSSPLQP